MGVVLNDGLTPENWLLDEDVEATYTELLEGARAKAWVSSLQDSMYATAEATQTAAAKSNQDRVWLENGEKTLAVNTTSFHYWGQRLGYECWRDDGFVREFARDNVAARVRSRAPNATVPVGWDAAEGYRSRRAASGQSTIVANTVAVNNKRETVRY